MFYQVRANLFFHEEDEAIDFYHDCQIALPKASVINPGTPEQECSVIDFIKCYHDEQPHGSCDAISHEDNCPLSPP